MVKAAALGSPEFYLDIFENIFRPARFEPVTLLLVATGFIVAMTKVKGILRLG